MPQVILLLEPGISAGDFEALSPRVLRSGDDVAVVFHERGPSLWIVPDPLSLEPLVRIGGGRHGDQRLLVLSPIDFATSTALQGIFSHVVCRPDIGHLIPDEEIAGVLSDEAPGESSIGGFVHHRLGIVVLHRGDLSTMVVPLEWLANPHTVSADPHDFEVVDYGHGVRLGAFEAATDKVLYDFDPVVRIKLAEQDRINLAEERRILAERAQTTRPAR
jgi:hypothetical protein